MHTNTQSTHEILALFVIKNSQFLYPEPLSLIYLHRNQWRILFLYQINQVERFFYLSFIPLSVKIYTEILLLYQPHACLFIYLLKFYY